MHCDLPLSLGVHLTFAVGTANSGGILLSLDDKALAVPRQHATFVEDVLERMQRGGRLLYLGAGTSGRLGVLDGRLSDPLAGEHEQLGRVAHAKATEATEQAVEEVVPFRFVGHRPHCSRQRGPTGDLPGPGPFQSPETRPRGSPAG